MYQQGPLAPLYDGALTSERTTSCRKPQRAAHYEPQRLQGAAAPVGKMCMSRWTTAKKLPDGSRAMLTGTHT
jgi:hypothetical protein